MKLSIAWIFDHIDADWKKQDINNLVKRFNQVTAEIEDFYKVEFDLKNFSLAKVVDDGVKNFKVSIPEWKTELELPCRELKKHFLPENFSDLAFLVYKDNDKIRWATLADFNVDKDGLLAPVSVSDGDLKGKWKDKFENKDVIIEVDNKTVTHRPDMWGHRGFAREIAAFLDLPFIPESKFIKNVEVISADKKTKPTKDNPISIEISNSDNCKRFAGTYFSSIQHQASDITMFSRILKVGSRPINSVIDLTNYLMLDWSQPVHAYDASRIEGQKIVARMAKKSETLSLLDGTDAKLTTEDLVICDKKKPLCLAGIVGGAKDSVGANTKEVFLEAANFYAGSVRKSALRHKVRTESSSRFEKTLDPNQITTAIQRFLFLADQFGVKLEGGNEIVCVGPKAEVKKMEIPHSFFEKRSGFELSVDEIVKPLRKLEFEVSLEDRIYKITVPSFRSSKDVEIKEDILEEVIRFYGFDNIKLKFPSFERRPYDLTPIFRTRKIKSFFTSVAKMMEHQNYVFYDEDFINSLNFSPENYLELLNPASDNLKKMATSLVPGLLKNIKDNFVQNESLRFFELGRIWEDHQKGLVEQKRLSGIFFEKRKSVDFYECKSLITLFLEGMGIGLSEITFEKVNNPSDPWFRKYQTAKIYVGDEKIGIIGCMEKTFLSKLDVLPESDAFIFDLDAEFLLNFEAKEKKFKLLPKYQETTLDFSILLPLEITTKKVEDLLAGADELVSGVKLIDYFEKKEWSDKRSLTFRVNVTDTEKTLEKSEIDSVWNKCVKLLEDVGAKLRS